MFSSSEFRRYNPGAERLVTVLAICNMQSLRKDCKEVHGTSRLHVRW